MTCKFRSDSGIYEVSLLTFRVRAGIVRRKLKSKRRIEKDVVQNQIFQQMTSIESGHHSQHTDLQRLNQTLPWLKFESQRDCDPPGSKIER